MKSSIRAMLGMILPFTLMGGDLLTNTSLGESPSKGSSKLKKGRSFKSVYAGDEPYQKPTTELGRNELCHCGSGKKYKKCCSIV